jgi:hypothetical protein
VTSDAEPARTAWAICWLVLVVGLEGEALADDSEDGWSTEEEEEASGVGTVDEAAPVEARSESRLRTAEFIDGSSPLLRRAVR